jgi:hypothetical protein
MTWDNAIAIARESWAAFNRMPLDRWRAMVNVRTMGQDERWRQAALTWMEMNFTVARDVGMK